MINWLLKIDFDLKFDGIPIITGEDMYIDDEMYYKIEEKRDMEQTLPDFDQSFQNHITLFILHMYIIGYTL